MFIAELRKEGDEYVVTIPDDEVELRGLREGQRVAIQVDEVTTKPELRPELRRILDDHWEELEPATRYLAGR